MDALDECAAVHQVRLLDLLRQIFAKSAGTRIFIIGRRHIPAGVKERNHPIHCVRMGEGGVYNAADGSLIVKILADIPQRISEM